MPFLWSERIWRKETSFIVELKSDGCGREWSQIFHNQNHFYENATMRFSSSYLSTGIWRAIFQKRDFRMGSVLSNIENVCLLPRWSSVTEYKQIHCNFKQFLQVSCACSLVNCSTTGHFRLHTATLKVPALGKIWTMGDLFAWKSFTQMNTIYPSNCIAFLKQEVWKAIYFRPRCDCSLLDRYQKSIRN